MCMAAPKSSPSCSPLSSRSASAWRPSSPSSRSVSDPSFMPQDATPKDTPPHNAVQINGRAYLIVDHAYDVVVVGAGGSGLRAVVGCSEAGLGNAFISHGVSHRSHDTA